jgi:hypothetical protein
LADVSEEIISSIIGVYQTTRRNISEDSHLQTRCRENLKSYQGETVKDASSLGLYHILFVNRKRVIHLLTLVATHRPVDGGSKDL